MTPQRLRGHDVPAIQRRTLGTLSGSQVLGGVGVASGLAVAAIVAEQLLGSATWAGLAGTAQVLGAALMTVPMARTMAAVGRRVGLTLGYVVGSVGAGLAVLAQVRGSFALLVAGAALFGAATTSNSQARYAAADLAPADRRGRALSVAVWATTVGAVAGPNLLGVAGDLAAAVDLPRLAGPFLISFAGFVLAAVLLSVLLRPDPLLLARRLDRDAGRDTVTHGSVRRGFVIIAARPAALLGAAAVTLGHTVMVSVMVMTPLQMHHGGADLQLVGLVISGHVLGMYAFSPITGLLVDRLGPVLLVRVGTGLFAAAVLLAGLAPAGWSASLTAGLFLLGLGWSCTFVAGSTLLASSVPVGERAGVQGAGDLAMGLAAAAGGAVAGVVVGQWGYDWLCVSAGALAVVLAGLTLTLGPLQDRRTNRRIR